MWAEIVCFKTRSTNTLKAIIIIFYNGFYFEVKRVGQSKVISTGK